MRRAIFALIFLVLFIVACGNNQVETAIRQQQGVRLFAAINGNVTYSQKSYSGSDAKSMSDVIAQDCPQGVGDAFVRTTVEAKAMTLVVYTTPDGKNATCTVIKPTVQNSITIKKTTDAPSPQIAIVVNGNPITYAQIQQAVALLPKGTALDANTSNTLLMNLIDNELLREQATSIAVTSDDIAQARATILGQANITEAMLPIVLQAQNITPEVFDQSVHQQAQITNLLNQKLLMNEINVSDDDARTYYLQNTAQFMQPEQAVARYITISSAGRSLIQGKQLAQEIANQLNTTDFCTLVQKYSDDKNGKSNCGVYVVPRGVLDPNLEAASYGTPANQTAIVTTNGGIYFVQTLQINPAQVTPYPQIASTLQAKLRSALLQQRLALYFAVLRDNANITSYLG